MHRVAFTLVSAALLLMPSCGKEGSGRAAPQNAESEARDPIAVLREARTGDDFAALDQAATTLAARRSDPESFRAVALALDHAVPGVRRAAALALVHETRPFVSLRRLERIDAFLAHDDSSGRDPDEVLVALIRGLAEGRGDAMAIDRLERTAALPDGAADSARAAAGEILGRFIALGVATSEPVVRARPPRLRRFDAGDPRGLVPTETAAPGTLRADWRIDAEIATFRFTISAAGPMPERLWIDHLSDDPEGAALDVHVNGKPIVRILAQPLIRSHLLPIPRDLLRRGPNEFTFKRAVGRAYRLAALHVEDHP